jgi:hypothetical protein
MADVNALNRVIRLGLGRAITKKPKRNGRKLFVTTLGWIRLPVVFNDALNCLVTVLPPDAKEVLRWTNKQTAR